MSFYISTHKRLFISMSLEETESIAHVLLRCSFYLNWRKDLITLLLTIRPSKTDADLIPSLLANTSEMILRE